MAAELLKKVEHRGIGIEMPEAQSLLENPEFIKDMLAVTDTDEETLLHLAAKNPDSAILKLVLEAYKSHDMLKKAFGVKNKFGNNPLKEAVMHGHLANNVKILFKEYQEICPEAITEAKSGYTILHQSIATGERSVEIVQFLLSQKECQPMLSVMWEDEVYVTKGLPLGVAEEAVRQRQSKYEYDLSQAEKRIKAKKMSPAAAKSERRRQTGYSEQSLRDAEEIVRLLKSHA